MPDGTGNQPPPLAGQLLADRYRLDAPLEAGTTGDVWSARDTVLNRPVAVKLIKQEHAADDAFVSRFRAESRSAAALSHSGVAQVFDYGEHEGFSPPCPYLVMESVSGRQLSALTEQHGPLPADIVLDITAQAARALQAAHDIGITHRDIRPGKLLVTDDGRVKVTDFGIASVTYGTQSTTAAGPDPVRAATYMAPEQAEGGVSTPASDIYSLGVVAYESLTGRLPFSAGTPRELAAARAEGEPRPLPEEIPAPVGNLVMRMLAREPWLRPGSAQAVADRAAALRKEILAAGMPGPQAAPGSASPPPPAPARPGAAESPGPTGTAEPVAPPRRVPAVRSAVPALPDVAPAAGGGPATVAEMAPPSATGTDAAQAGTDAAQAGTDAAEATLAQPPAGSAGPWAGDAGRRVPAQRGGRSRSTVAVAAAVASLTALAGAIAALMLVGNPGKPSGPPRNAQSPGPAGVQAVVPAVHPTVHPTARATTQAPMNVAGVNTTAPPARPAAAPAPRHRASPAPTHSTAAAPTPPQPSTNPGPTTPPPPPSSPPSTP